MKRLIRASLVIITIILSVSAVPAQAQDKLVLSPAFTDSGAIDTSKTHRVSVTLYNQTNLRQTFNVRTVVLVVDSQTNQLAFAPNNAPDISYLGTLDVPEEIVVAAGSSYTVSSEFKLAPFVAPGSHQFAILFQPQLARTGNTNLILGELAAIINFTSGGQLAYRADMNLSPVPNPSITQGPQLDVDVSNRGNVIIQPQGVINVRTVVGIPQTFSQNFNSQAQLLFQGQTRNFDVQLDFGNRAVLGLYEAEAVVAYGPQHKVMTRTTNLVILPWYFLALFVTVFIATIVIVYYKRKSKYAPAKTRK